VFAAYEGSAYGEEAAPGGKSTESTASGVSERLFEFTVVNAGGYNQVDKLHDDGTPLKLGSMSSPLENNLMQLQRVDFSVAFYENFKSYRRQLTLLHLLNAFNSHFFPYSTALPDILNTFINLRY
jgi:hypothetical protein